MHRSDHKVSPLALACLHHLHGAQKAQDWTGKPALERDSRYLPPGPRVACPKEPPGFLQTSVGILCPTIHPNNRSQLESTPSDSIWCPWAQIPPSYTFLPLRVTQNVLVGVLAEGRKHHSSSCSLEPWAGFSVLSSEGRACCPQSPFPGSAAAFPSAPLEPLCTGFPRPLSMPGTSTLVPLWVRMPASHCAHYFPFFTPCQSSSCQCDTPEEREPSLRNCLHQTGPSVCLGIEELPPSRWPISVSGPFSWLLVDAQGLSPLWAVPFPGEWIWL